jgi:hypothetical protein
MEEAKLDIRISKLETISECSKKQIRNDSRFDHSLRLAPFGHELRAEWLRA